jgi:hypothetical protein
MTTSALPALLSSCSLALAAFGLFFNSVRAELDEAAKQVPQQDTNVRAGQSARAGRARNTALALAAIASLAAAALVPEAWPYIREAGDDVIHWDFGEYEAQVAVFCVVALAWIPFALFLFARAKKLHDKKTQLA